MKNIIAAWWHAHVVATEEASAELSAVDMALDREALDRGEW